MLKMSLDQTVCEDLKAFERRLTEVIASLQPSRLSWRILLGFISVCTAVGAWHRLTDPNTSAVSFTQSLYNHPIFGLASILLGITPSSGDGNTCSAMMGISEWCHYKCRNGFYPGTKIKRFPVPDNLTSWTNQPILMTQLRPIVKDWPEYAPVEYTSPTVPGKPWADPDITDPLFKPRWNAIDGDIDRRSNARGRPGVLYSYPLTDDGRPKNPLGRTGVTGRGLLGRWGPNHAADSIITRWKNTPTPSTAPKEDVIIEPGVLQFVAIKRQDTKQWAIPEGMVDPGGAVSDTLKREFMKEAMNSLGRRSKTAIHVYIRRIDELFKRGDVVYKGYIDDPRNTDNAWIETTAVNFHDNDGTILNKIPLSVGDDACKVQWMDIDEELELYGEHSMLLRYVTVLRNAHWKK